MDEKRVDSMFSRYVEHLVMHGETLQVEELTGGDPELAAALQERLEALGRVRDALERRSKPLTGKTLLHYRVREKLATGGMGEVYLAEDLNLDRNVAIKVLPARLSLDPERRRRFEREARILAGLNHRNITTIHGIEEADGVEFLVLELVPGKTLAELIRGGPLGVEETVPLFKEIAEALEAAHEKGVVHRDLKPANIMVMPGGQVKVLDFGLGKNLGDRERFEPRGPTASSVESTGAGHILGTAAYMSPEQARGEEVDRRADLWSFGCVLYEALSGKKPFPGTNLSETVAAILDGNPDWSVLPPETPASIRALLRKCLTKDQDHRLDDIADARVALESSFDRRLQDRLPAQQKKRHSRLPAAVTPFFGREDEIAGIHNRLQDPACRLLTLVGPGGIGKTRLALEAARNFPDFFSDGVCFVSLSALDSSAFLFAALGNGLGLTLKDAGDPRTIVLGILKEREALLILDSFELMAHEANVLSEILAVAPRVKCLVTSRVTLGLPGEWLWEVTGLPCPPEEAESSAEVSSFPSVGLFLESARRVRTTPLDESLPDVVRLCRRVQGMPLAIELSAASLRERTCEEIASALEAGLDVLKSPATVATDRNRSARASFEHSWRLLSDEERTLFQSLSIFRGGFRRDAAQKIAGATPEGLSILLNSSFLHWDEASGRFTIHDLLRRFGLEKLRVDSEAFEALRERFCRFFARLLTVGLESGADLHALSTLTEEIDNVRAAWSYAIESRDIEVLNQTLDGLWGLHDLRGWLREGEETLRAAVEMLEALPSEDSTQPRSLVVRLLIRHAWFLHRLGFLVRAKAQLEKARSQIPADDSQRQIDLAVLTLASGMVDLTMGDYRRVLALLDTDFTIGMSAAYGRIILGFGLLFTGAYDDVETLSRPGVEWATRAGDERSAAQCLALLGGASSALGNRAEARRFLEWSLVKIRHIEDRVGYYFVYDFLGLDAFASGNYAEAIRFHEKSLKCASRMAIGWCEAEARAHLGHALAASGKNEAAAQQLREALRSARDMRAAPTIMDAVAGLAFLGAPSARETAKQLLSEICKHPAAKAVTKTHARDFLDWIPKQEATLVQSETATPVSIDELESSVAGVTLRDEGAGHGVAFSSRAGLLVPLTPLVGREEELQSINDLLREPGCRMITLVGASGIGKTRLAIQAARQALDRFRDGVCFAPLASVWHVRELDAAIADAIGFSSGGNSRASLLAHLRDKEMLLLLDGFEHLLAGKELLWEISSAAPATKLLVTSRERLDLPGERLLEIPTLEFPDVDADPERVAEYDAVKLFVQEAYRRRPDFRPSQELPAIARICRLLKGKPRAIELAAAWVRELDCGAIADALERIPDLSQLQKAQSS